MAEQNLRLGHDVVVDAVNDSAPARQTWRTAASRTGAHLEFVYLVTSDVKEHQRRLNGRDRGLVHVGEPSWSDVQRRRTEYASWSDEVLEFDAAVRGVDDIAGVLATRLSKT